MGSCVSTEGGRGTLSSSYSASSSSSLSKTNSCYSVKTTHHDGFKTPKIHYSFGSNDDYSTPRLNRIHERVVKNGGNSISSLFSREGKKGLNQDTMIVWEKFGLRADTVLCGVFDGHGPFGHMVAKKVRDALPLKLSSFWEEENVCSYDPDDNGTCNSTSSSGTTGTDDSFFSRSEEEPNLLTDSDEKEKCLDIFTGLKDSFLKAYRSMDDELKTHPCIDCFSSGTTAVTLIKQGLDLVIANVGDSRAVLGTRDDDRNLVAVQLTVDLKPTLPREQERIKKCNGRVLALEDEPEVTRVWLPNSDTPGLAMTRAFGDFCLKDYGVISVPEVSYRRITDRDEFVVLATDGLWDVLSNEEVVDIVEGARRNGRSVAKSLVKSANEAWETKIPNMLIDDCAVVCLFLKDQPSDVNERSESGTPKIEKKKHEFSFLHRSTTLRSRTPFPFLHRSNTHGNKCNENLHDKENLQQET